MRLFNDMRYWFGKRRPKQPDLFDSKWYLTKYHDVISTGKDAFRDYQLRGWKEGRAPHPLFDPEWYLSKNPDIKCAGTDPFTHYLEHGWKEGRDPHPSFRCRWYLKQNSDVADAGIEPLAHFVSQGWREGRFPHPGFHLEAYLSEVADVEKTGESLFANDPEQDLRRLVELGIGRLTEYLNANHPRVDADTLIREKFGPNYDALPVYALPGNQLRVNLITCSIGRSNLFGGVGTALIFACLLAEKWGCPLRVITRTERPEPDIFHELLIANGIQRESNVEFLFADRNNPSSRISVSDGDVFITTSHWTTHSVMGTVARKNIIYILQEDERMFFAEGDEKVLCERIMADDAIRYVINTELLYNHLLSSGFENLRTNGTWFEPSFPNANGYHMSGNGLTNGKRNFMFYAGPNHPRNLFYFGLKLIETAIVKGVLNPESWNLHFVGKDLCPIRIAGGIVPAMVQSMSWAEYHEYLKSVDLGLCLMATPHPSYPPLDLASFGGVAITNKCGIKQSLDKYSKNIICGELTASGMLEAFRKGIELAEKMELRSKNLEEDHLIRDWTESFAASLDYLTARMNVIAKPCIH
ncbi:MAG: hypothetical protein ABI318_09235 [Chthoniobacteraceae bacterium]